MDKSMLNEMKRQIDMRFVESRHQAFTETTEIERKIHIAQMEAYHTSIKILDEVFKKGEF